jgi:hypothetical protein
MLYNRKSNQASALPGFEVIFFKGVTKMAKTPTEVLRKYKSTDSKEDKNDDDDAKKGSKPSRANALMLFISKHKKASK